VARGSGQVPERKVSSLMCLIVFFFSSKELGKRNG
jgi:hypothetical protein